MKLNRNHYFLIGLIVLFLGIQFRLVESFTLNEPISRAVQKRIKTPGAQTMAFAQQFVSAPQSMRRHTVRPPKFVGWILISVGAVMVLQSFAMRKPG